ncbi:hypothetical protein B0H12DRAFT_80422 [Mycena haematopus]|nr:hypothetical protein B0H12DRAFT_80422 [Mycena haematopus]
MVRARLHWSTAARGHYKFRARQLYSTETTPGELSCTHNRHAAPLHQRNISLQLFLLALGLLLSLINTGHPPSITCLLRRLREFDRTFAPADWAEHTASHWAHPSTPYSD